MGDQAPKPGAATVPPPGTKSGAPKDPNAAKRGRGRPKGSGTNAANIEKTMTTFFQSLAVPFKLFGDDQCAMIITQGAPALGKSWAELAKVNPAVARILNSLTEGSVYGGLIYAHLMVLAPIAMHHGLWPAGIPNPMKMAQEAQAAQAAAQNGNASVN